MKNRALIGIAAAALVASLGGGVPAERQRTPQRVGDQRATAVGRIWRGRTLASKADEYQTYLNASGITRILATPGNLGVSVLRRAQGDKAEFLVLSIWDSIDAVKRFAGEDYQKAVILPRDREYLVEVEPNVLHYEIVREERRH